MSPPHAQVPIGQFTFLYIFTCIKERCCNENECWKALRYTLSPRELDPRQSNGDSQAKSTRKERQEKGLYDTWGLSDTIVKQGNDDSFDFSDLMASLDDSNKSKEVAGKDSIRPKVDAGVASSSSVDEESFVPWIDPRLRSSCIAGFYLKFSNDAEKLGDLDVKPKGMESRGREEETEGEGEGWEGEKYEKDKVLVLEGRKGVSQAGWHFIKRVQRMPNQCIRQAQYSSNANSKAKEPHPDRPLWPYPDLPTPSCCPYCASRRIFAVQLMTPMISAIAEAKEWLEEELGEEGETSLRVETLPLSSGWATVAVYICEQGCVPPSDGGYAVEEVVIGMED